MGVDPYILPKNAEIPPFPLNNVVELRLKCVENNSNIGCIGEGGQKHNEVGRTYLPTIPTYFINNHVYDCRIEDLR